MLTKGIFGLFKNIYYCSMFCFVKKYTYVEVTLQFSFLYVSVKPVGKIKLQCLEEVYVAFSVTGQLCMSCVTGQLYISCVTGQLYMSCATGQLYMSCVSGQLYMSCVTSPGRILGQGFMDVLL